MKIVLNRVSALLPARAPAKPAQPSLSGGFVVRNTSRVVPARSELNVGVGSLLYCTTSIVRVSTRVRAVTRGK